MGDEITDISFSEDEKKSQISVYMGIPGVHEIPPNKVCVWFSNNSMEVRVIDVKGSNKFYLARELWGHIDPNSCSWKARKDKLSIKLPQWLLMSLRAILWARSLNS